MAAFVFLGIVALSLAVVSCIPGADDLYTSVPMIILWCVTALSAGYVMLKRKLYRRPAVFVLHIALGVILVGALSTHLWGHSERLHLRLGESARVGELEVVLNDFSVEYYPGTVAPSDFISRLRIGDKEARISMNKVFSDSGYRFYQSSFDSDRAGVVLTVTYDPVGVAVTYAGYALLLLAMVVCSLPRRWLLRTGFCFVLLIPFAADAKPRTLPRDVADELGKIYVYHNDRVAPLSTLARDFTVKLTGKAVYEGLSSEQVLAGWLFYYDNWKKEPCVRIKDAATRQKMNLSWKYASLKDFFSKDGTYLFDDGGYAEANEKFSMCSSAATGSLWTVFPYVDPVDSTAVRWFSPIDDTPVGMSVEDWQITRHSLNYLAELIYQSQWDEAKAVIAKIGKYQQKKAGAILPSSTQVMAERLFMSLADSVIPAVLLIVSGLILFITGRRRLAVWVDVVGALWVAFIICLNWVASGRMPMANGYETMQWMALAACLSTVVISKKYPLLPSLGAVVAGLSLMVAMMGLNNPQVTQLMPVLRSPLLSVHVLAVMIAYAMLALMAFCGVGWLLGRKELLVASRAMLRPAVFLLAAGIFIGAVWANMSWGRYWGWDPKEVWALITMLTYSIPLHGATLPVMRRDKIYAIYTVAAFATVLVTYFGVNIVLGGMHSYSGMGG